MRRAALLVCVLLAACAAAPAGAHAADASAAKAATKDRTAGAKQKRPGQRTRCRRGTSRKKTSGARRGGDAKRCPKAKKKSAKPKPKPKPSAPTPAPTPGGTGTTAPAPTGGGSSGDTAPTPGVGARDGDTPTPELNAVGVKAYDRDGVFVFETTRSTVRSGALSVNFHNYDLDDHNLWIEGTAPLVGPLKLSDEIPLHGDVTKDVTLAAGAYRFFCTVPGHGSMTRALTVSG